MVEFDKQRWVDKAWERFQKVVRKTNSKKKLAYAEARFYRDSIFISKLKTVVEWCNSKGIQVHFGKKAGGVYDANTKNIVITSHSSPEKQLYYLLHECGHHLIGFTEHHERFGMGYPQTETPGANQTFHHRLACLEEEIEAWQRGWKLSKRLKLKIRREEFDELRLECLKTYVQWSNTRILLKST